jgi:iron complex transport system substrate-binding protein
MIAFNSRLTICLIYLIVFSAQGAYAGLYIDKTGREVDIPSSPKRIVSLAPSITETLFALGLSEEIVGVTMFSDYPEAARSKPRVGSYVNISIEKVVSLDPDLIIGTADGNGKEIVKQFERFGFPVYVVNPTSLDEIFEMVLDVGKITGKDRAAKDLVHNLRKRVGFVVSRTRDIKKPRVFFQIGVDPVVTVGRDAFGSRLIALAGGLSISREETVKYPRYTMEKIIAEQPEIIIVSSMKRGGDFERVRNGWNRWKDIPAVKKNRIYILNSDLIDHPSPVIVDGLEELARIIHPEIFILQPPRTQNRY